MRHSLSGVTPMELNWSKWFRCESSFGLLLVPHQPGVFALAEEVQPAGAQARRMLAVFEINEAEDVCRALSRLFAPASPWHSRLTDSRCYLRYAIVPDAQERKAAASALKTWLSSQADAASQIFEQRVVQPGNPVDATVAEQAVDTVMKNREMARPAFPAGF